MFCAALLPFFLWAQVCLADQNPLSTADVDVDRKQTSLLLMERVERLESLVLHRNQDTVSQLALLRHQLYQQASRLSRQQQVIRVQGGLIRRQSLRLHEQDKLLHELAANQSVQGGLLGQQNVRLSKQDKLLGRQVKQMLLQEELLSQCESFLRQRTADTGNNASGLPYAPPSLPENNTPGVLQASPSTSHQESRTRTVHDVMSRSDDNGPLEVVVNQLSQRVTEMTADIQAFKIQTQSNVQTLQSSDTLQQQQIQDAQSSTFVHWGSSHCSNASDLVYSGVVGGSYYSDPGGATNYLCLTMAPVFGSHAPPTVFAHLFGSEYETRDGHQDLDPVCSVCQSTFSTTVMIPGTNVCTPGWHLQYSGFLMAGYYQQVGGSEFICVDSKLESRIGSDLNRNGVLMYYTLTTCGSLPCDPYINNKVVLCAVCSK